MCFAVNCQMQLSPDTTAMYRVKQLFGGSLTLRDYDGQVAEAMALVRALNKMTKAGMPESVVYCLKTQPSTGGDLPKI